MADPHGKVWAFAGPHHAPGAGTRTVDTRALQRHAVQPRALATVVTGVTRCENRSHAHWPSTPTRWSQGMPCIGHAP